MSPFRQNNGLEFTGTRAHPFNPSYKDSFTNGEHVEKYHMPNIKYCGESVFFIFFILILYRHKKRSSRLPGNYCWVVTGSLSRLIIRNIWPN